jgi:hypothetical protein
MPPDNSRAQKCLTWPIGCRLFFPSGFRQSGNKLKNAKRELLGPFL